jgi:hypothetical protein
MLTKFGNWTIEVVQRIADVVSFAVLPRRWVVERTLAWLNRNRRLAKDFEATIASAETWLYLASGPSYSLSSAGEKVAKYIRSLQETNSLGFVVNREYLALE